MMKAALSLHHAAQHILQNAAMAEIFELVERVDAAEQLHLIDRATGAVNTADELGARLQALGDAQNIETLGALELQALAVHALLELQRQHRHADEIGAMNALEAFDDHGAHAQELRALGRPVAR